LDACSTQVGRGTRHGFWMLSCWAERFGAVDLRLGEVALSFLVK
jgi:hypothetical protein